MLPKLDQRRKLELDEEHDKKLPLEKDKKFN